LASWIAALRLRPRLLERQTMPMAG